MYVYIYIYIYTYVYVYIYIYTMFYTIIGHAGWRAEGLGAGPCGKALARIILNLRYV